MWLYVVPCRYKQDCIVFLIPELVMHSCVDVKGVSDICVSLDSEISFY